MNAQRLASAHQTHASSITRRTPLFTTAAAILALAVLITGCGSSSEQESTNAAPGADATSGVEQNTDATGAGKNTNQAPGTMHFTDVSDEAGIDFVRTTGDMPPSVIVQVKGGGLGLIDYDNDGDRDLFIANGAPLDDPENGPGSRLYENLGNLQFRDVTEQANINLTRWAMGVAVGDYNGDRFDDLYVTCYGQNVLLRNNGDGTFADVTEHAGVGDERWGTSCAWGDIDNDGDLDLYVVNYLDVDVSDPPPPSRFKDIDVLAGPNGLPAQHDVLYENLGDGTFRDITQSAGCLPDAPAYGLNTVMLDFTDDEGARGIDIFVGNDSMANFLFVNRNDPSQPSFDERGLYAGVASNMDGSDQATMGIAVGDVNGNGRPDIFTTNFSSDTNTLHVNIDGTFFEDRTDQYGLGMASRTYLGWAAGFFDFDHDADEDLLIVNGHVYPQASMETMDSPYRQTPLLFQRNEARFERVAADTAGEWLSEPHLDRSAVFDDLDGDGDIDFIIGELDGRPRVIRNDVDRGNWLIVSLQDNRENTDNHRGVGSKITLHNGEHTQTRWLFTGGSFQSTSALIAHFAVREPAENRTLTVTWPDGQTQTITDVPIPQHLVVERE